MDSCDPVNDAKHNYPENNSNINTNINTNNNDTDKNSTNNINNNQDNDSNIENNIENNNNDNNPSYVGSDYWQNRRNTDSSSTLPCISVSSLASNGDETDQPGDGDEVRELIREYSRTVLTDESTADVFTEAEEDMDAKEWMDWMVKTMQTMGQKLVEYDERISTLQSDNEFLRTENTRLKNAKKVQPAISMPSGEPSLNNREHDSSSTSSNCCCCDTTVDRVASLQRDVANLQVSLNTLATSQEWRTAPPPPSVTSTTTSRDNVDDSSVEDTGNNNTSNNTYTVHPRDADADADGSTQTGHVTANSSLTRHKKVVILSDSMCGGMDNRRLNRALENKTTYKKVFPGGTPEDVDYYSVRTLTVDKPDISIIHTGTNRIGKSDPFEIAHGIIKNVNR